MCYKEVFSTKIDPLSPYSGTGKGREQEVWQGEKERDPEEESEARHHLRTRVHRHRQANQRRRVFIHECIQNGKPLMKISTKPELYKVQKVQFKFRPGH